MRRWRKCAVLAVGLVAACAVSSVARAGINLRLQTPAPAIAPGDTFVVEAAITIPETRFNAFDLVVRYDTTRVALVPTTPLSNQVGPLVMSTCANVFHRFNAYPDSVVANVSLLCNQTFITGNGALYRLRFRALPGSGPTTVTVGRGTRFYNAGVFVAPIVAEDMTVMIGGSVAAPAPAANAGYLLEAPQPNPLRATDAGTIVFRLPAPADVVLQLFDTQGRQVARREVGGAPAGRSRVHWTLPRLAAGRYEIRMRAGGVVVGRAPWVKLR